MHPFASPYNTGPQACEAPGKAPESRFSTFVVVSALLHLAVICSFFHWHGEAPAPLFAGKTVIEVGLGSIPVMNEAAAAPGQPDAMPDELPALTPVPETSHTQAAEITAALSTPVEKPPPPVEKRAVVAPAPAQKEALAPVEELVITEPSAPPGVISNKTALYEADSGATGDSSSESFPGAPAADESVAPDSTGTLAPGTSPGQRYVEKNFYYVKDLITRNLSYPVAARRMKWQGTVVVSFTVREDGTAENIKVVTSSGYRVLDRNVIATIEAFNEAMHCVGH
jgi:protein TonB